MNSYNTCEENLITEEKCKEYLAELEVGTLLNLL